MVASSACTGGYYKAKKHLLECLVSNLFQSCVKFILSKGDFDWQAHPNRVAMKNYDELG